jgi:hypothetical protein
MPPTFEPLKLLENATAAVMGQRRRNHTSNLRRAILDEDSSEDDEPPTVKTPLVQQDNDPTLSSPVKETSVDDDAAQSTPRASPPLIPTTTKPAADNITSPSVPTTALATKAKKKAKLASTVSRKATAITPCAKRGGTLAVDSPTTTAVDSPITTTADDISTPVSAHGGVTVESAQDTTTSTSTTHPVTPAAAAAAAAAAVATKSAVTSATTLLKQKLRMSLVEHASETALFMARQLLSFTEEDVKQWKDECKQRQRTIKHLEHLERAQQDSREFTKVYKKLVKQLEKCRRADVDKDTDLINARKEIKQLSKRKLLEESDSTTKTDNGNKAKKTKMDGAAKGKKKPDVEEWKSDAESEEPSNEESEGDEGSEEDGDEDDDSCWKGKGGTTKTTERGETSASGAPSSTSKRSSRRPTTHEWACTVCTFLNESKLMKCGVCGTKK